VAETIELGFTIELLTDIGKCIPHFHEEDAQFWRRAAFRGLFGYLEAWMSVIRQHFVPDMIRDHLQIIAPDDDTRKYIAGLLAATDPVHHLLNDKGESYTRNRKLHFEQSLKATVRLYLLVSLQTREEIDEFFKKPEWALLVRAVKVRDRLMHPQRHEDIMVSEQDVDDFSAVLRFLQELGNRGIASQTIK
jgi:hypothetical protein